MWGDAETITTSWPCSRCQARRPATRSRRCVRRCSIAKLRERSVTSATSRPASREWNIRSLALSADSPLRIAPTTRGNANAKAARFAVERPAMNRSHSKTLPPSVSVPSRSNAARTGGHESLTSPVSQAFGSRCSLNLQIQWIIATIWNRSLKWRRPVKGLAKYTQGAYMAIRLGDVAPDFSAETTEGPINFHEWLGDGWGVLFWHPKDFTPVGTTELRALAARKAEFDERNNKIIGLSVDDVASHEKWKGDIAETQGSALNFPVIGDENHKVADLYDMIHPNANDTLTVRSVFIIGPDKKVKLTLTYPASTGRNIDEILRVLDSLQLTANYQVATPVNWTDGGDVIIVNSVSDEEATTKFPKGFKKLKPYLRVTPQPNK